MKRVLSVAALALVLGLAFPARQCLAQHRLVRVRVETQEQFDRLAALGLDIASSLRGSHADVVADSDDMNRIALLGFKSEVLVPDLESEMSSRGDGLGAYHTYAESRDELMEAAARYPDIAVVDSIGRTYENRAIWAIKISDSPWINDPTEADILFVGLHHAREVITPDVVLYLMHHLLDNYGLDPRVTRLVNDREIWIVPVLNADGHVFVEHGNFLWRKNRRPPPSGLCIGVDPNRNYGFMWGLDNVGSSGLTCSETYRGGGPFSEDETQAIRDLVLDDAHNFTAAITYHSYGRLILYPWGYTTEPTPDADIFRALGDSMAAYNGYRAGPSYTTIYTTNGDFDDWMYGDKVVTEGIDPRHPDNEKERIFSFTFEVGDSFKPDTSKIPQLVSENLEPNLFLIEYGDDPNRLWPPDTPIMEEPVRTAGAGWELHWRTESPFGSNPPVGFELERTAGARLGVDDLESGPGFWEGNGFDLSEDRSYSGAHSLHTGAESNLLAVLEPMYPLRPTATDTLGLRCWYSLPVGHDLFTEMSDDGGRSFRLLPGVMVPAGGDPLPYAGLLTGDSNGWVEVRLPLGDHAGEEVMFRLRCSTTASKPGEGVYIDDIGPVLKYRDRRILEGLSSGVYRLDVSPEDVVFRARSIDAEGQRSSWSSRVTVPAFDGALRRVTVVPNPIVSTARISYLAYEGRGGSESVPVKIEVFDAAGRLVRTVFKGNVRGDVPHEEPWDGLSDDGSALAGGVYFVVLTVRDKRVADKVVLVGGF